MTNDTLDAELLRNSKCDVRYTGYLQKLRSTAAMLTGTLVCACAVTHAQAPEIGLASWYGAEFDGRVAASGAVFHQEQLTAAHRSLPFGTTVRIRRTDTGASVVVSINDRGPFIESRIVDLSNAAARQLGMLLPGVVPVALEVVQAPRPDPHTLFAVQAGTFRVPANAERTRALMEKLYGSARVVPSPSDASLQCVLVGAAATQAEAETLASAVRKSAREFESAFIVKLPASLQSVAD
ncbi:MAG: septal ring lytic transglycosylase RlpA family protein [Candidatus Sulfopaludibacter sp.]|nr:septal ring lytic transglycosylase RlpA family protein [Candidatus Sulfopaludibacter sp.]